MILVKKSELRKKTLDIVY